MLKGILRLFAFLLIFSSCSDSDNQQETTENNSIKQVKSIVTTYTSTPSKNFTANYTYDEKQRISSYHCVLADGSSENEDFTYEDNKVIYHATTGQMTLTGEYKLNEKGYTDECVEANLYQGMTVKGINRFVYENNKLAVLSSTAQMGDTKRTWTDLKVVWKNGNIVDMFSDWTKDSNEDNAKQRKTTFKKIYNAEILNNTNLDMNYVIERNVQEKAVLTYDPLIAGACGPKSKNLISQLDHSIEFKPNEEMNYSFSYRFKYEVDENQLVRKISVIKPDGSIHATMEIMY